MLKKYEFSKDINYYILEDSVILINKNNSRWFVIDKNEFFEIKKNLKLYNPVLQARLNKTNFFEPLSEYKNLTLQFYVTNKCNLRCPHCYMYCENGMTNELSFDEKIKLIYDFNRMGGQKVVFTGGEVLMSPDFFELLKYTKLNTNLENVVLTNGVLWDTEKIDKYSSYIDSIQISIDGYDEISNSKTRGKGAFKKALDTVECFIFHSIPTVVCMTPLYGFEKDISQYISFCRTLVKKYSNNNFYIVFADGLLKGREIELSLKKNESYQKNSIKILENIYPDYIIGAFAEMHSQPLQNCGYGKIVVDSNGDFNFCTCIKELHKLGNIRNFQMNEIFRMSKLASRKTCIDYASPCNTCDFKYICGDKCRIEFFNNFNSISDVNNIPFLELKNNCSDNYKNNLLKKMKACFDRL